MTEREQFLERADEFLKDLGRGDFQDRDGELEALNRLAGQGDAPVEISLYSARFILPDNYCARSMFALWSCDLEIRRSISLYRDKPRDYVSELLLPWVQPRDTQEKSRPLPVGGRAGREIIRLEVGSSREDWWFIWQEDSPPASKEYFWQIYFSTRDSDQAPELLGLWRQMLERVRFEPR